MKSGNWIIPWHYLFSALVLFSTSTSLAQVVDQDSNGSLLIFGTADRDVVEIFGEPFLEPPGTTVVIVNDVEYSFSNISNVYIYLQGEDDVIFFDNVQVLGNLFVYMDDGHDNVFFTRGNHLVEGSLFVDLGNGDNQLEVSEPFAGTNFLTVQSWAQIHAGIGDDSIILKGNRHDWSGDVDINLGHGANFCQLWDGTYVGSNFCYTGGNGNDDFRFSYASGNPSLYSGDVTINLGDGQNDVFLNAAMVDGSTVIDGGAGVDELDFYFCHFDQQVHIATGDSADDITFLSYNNGNVDIEGAITVDTGPGDDCVYVQATRFLARFYLEMKTGFDTFQTSAGHFLGGLEIDTGSQADSVDLTGAITDGVTTIRTGHGWDDVRICDAEIRGSQFNVDTANGEDIVHVEDSDIYAQASISLGAKDDVFVTSDSDYHFSGKGATISILGGTENDTASATNCSFKGPSLLIGIEFSTGF